MPYIVAWFPYGILFLLFAALLNFIGARALDKICGLVGAAILVAALVAAADYTPLQSFFSTCAQAVGEWLATLFKQALDVLNDPAHGRVMNLICYHCRYGTFYWKRGWGYE